MNFVGEVRESQVDRRTLRQVRERLVLSRGDGHFQAPVGEHRFSLAADGGPRQAQRGLFVHFHFVLFLKRSDVVSSKVTAGTSRNTKASEGERAGRNALLRARLVTD